MQQDNNLSGLWQAPANHFENLAKAPTTKKYIGCKIIAAEPMTQEAFLKYQGKWQENQETLGDGYKVKYPDGYESWSPKKTFEEAYREISKSEYLLLHS
jgi:hypothetical protein